ncbi:MAG: DUF4843 domain-containing protein [Bacteroidales bacterium]|nr:DUF4843 domain-containing protein [Bacteroidales bacterium]
MKKNVLTILFISLVLCGCSQSEIPLYSGTDGIYFNNRTTGQLLSDSTAFSFIYYDFGSTDINVKVQTYGRAKDYDRPFVISVTSDEAKEGVDYEIVSRPVIPAGQSTMNFTIRLIKTPVLDESTLVLRLALSPNEHFGTNYPLAPNADESSAGTDALHYCISFSNQYTVPPLGWVTMFGGTFKPEKLDLLVSLFPEIPRQMYNEAGAITYAKWSYMQQTVTNYIAQQIQYYMMGMNYDPLIFDKDGNTLDFLK